MEQRRSVSLVKKAAKPLKNEGAFRGRDKSLKAKVLDWFAAYLDKPEYLSASQMNKRSLEYRKLCRKIDNNPWRHVSEHNRFCKLKYKAREYAAAVVDGRVKIRPEDGNAFINYISIVVSPVDKDSIGSQAISKVSAMLPEINNRSSAARTETVRSSVFGNGVNTMWHKAKKQLKVASVALLSGLGTLIGGKSCGETQKNNPQVLAVNVTAVHHKQTKVKPVNKNFETKKQPDFGKAAAWQKIWNNYYDTTIEILSSASQKQKLYSQIEKQLAAGVYRLPQDISREKLAYSYLIYKAYGISSSLDIALNSEEKLSPAAQQKLVEDVIKAGDKGEGARRLAAERHKGRLSSYSRYDKASPVLQKQHAENLTALMLVKKQNQAE